MGTILVRFLGDLRLMAKCNLDAVLLLVLFAFFCYPVSSPSDAHTTWPGREQLRAKHPSGHSLIRCEPALCGSIPEWAFLPT